MIPSLIFLLLRRYFKQHPNAVRRLRRHLHFVARLILVLLLTAGLACYAFAQERILRYEVTRNGSSIGTLTLKEIRMDNQVLYKLQSDIKTSLLFTISAKGNEEALYDNGIMIRSFFYQKVNNNERANTRMQAAGNAYTVVRNSNAKRLHHYPITYNLVCVYTIEPLKRTTVFSDKFQQYLPIQALGSHHYKITFPDGGYNEYSYQDGICTSIQVHGVWVNVEMSLKK